jgi:agmatine deiminase
MLDLDHPTPIDLGYRLPAEWTPHAATWTSWPSDDALWEGELDAVRSEFAAMISVLARFEPVIVNVHDDEAQGDAHTRLRRAGADLSRVRFHQVPLNDAWLRDNGPIFLVSGSGQVALSDWCFNAWGGKYEHGHDTLVPMAVARELGMRRFAFPYVLEGGALEVNDEGLLLTTRSCLLSPTRNPGLSEEETEALLRAGLGVRHVVWLDRGLEGDHTDGHIDLLARFCDDRTLVCALEDDPDDPNHEPTHACREALQALLGPDGEPVDVVPLPLPRQRRLDDGRVLTASYVNFYIVNGGVLVPTYGDPHDEEALMRLAPLFPDRDVVGVPAAHLVTGGGAWHCVTQQQPEGVIDHG